MPASEPSIEAESVVLDTNVVLDCLLFKDPACAALAGRLGSGRVRWLTCARMRDEFTRVLRYPALASWQPDGERLLASFDSLAVLLPDPAASRHGPLICSDPDDQVFIDLALAHRAAALITHDRALRKLARRAAVRGLAIVTPAAWAARR